MAITKYTYSIAADTLNGIVNLTSLEEEIRNSSIITALDNISTVSDSLDIYFKDAISTGDKSTLDSLVAAHDGTDSPDEPTQVEIAKQVLPPAFADKVLPDGKKLYRRKYGIVLDNSSTEIAAGQTGTLSFVVPYANAKINKLEIIGGRIGDCVDLKVYDTPTGTISTVPNYMLNQFGFDVYINGPFYADFSNYDADLIKDMKIELTYKNKHSTDSITPFANIVLHEVK